MSDSNLEERQEWDSYLTAYGAATNATATKTAPWHVIPSDDRPNQQLIIAHIMAELLESLLVTFSEKDDEEVRRLIREIEKQNA